MQQGSFVLWARLGRRASWGPLQQGPKVGGEIVFKLVWTPKWNIFPPEANPFKALEKISFTVSKPLPQRGKAPTATNALQRESPLAESVPIHAPCFLHPPLPTA